MIEQAEILEDDADAAAQIGDRILAEVCRVGIEQRDEAAGRLQRQQDEPQQSRLSGARGAGQELERPRLDLEADILEDLGSHSISQADIFESDQMNLVSRAELESRRAFALDRAFPPARRRELRL